MKILLIYPYCLENRLKTEDAGIIPIGMYYIGALLKENNYDVEIFNFHNLKNTPQRIKETLAEKKPDIIGFSILNANRWGGIQIAQIAKQLDPNVKIVFGGVTPTFLWKHFLTHFKVIDFIVTGEGEYPFLNLIQLIENDNYDNISDLKGIAYRKEERIVKTESARPIQDLDKLPIPAKYFKYQHVSLSRGCPGNCTFCGSPRFWGHKVRFHSSGYFVKHLELLYKQGVTFFYFSDDTFTMKKDQVIDICKRILKSGIEIKWVAISRVNYVGDEILYWMRKAGCIQISFGVESGSEKIRAVFNKKITDDQIKEAFSSTLKYGILARAYFIYGSPGENWATISDTIKLILQIKPLDIIFYILDIFPGTALYSDYKQKFKITDDIWLNQIEDILYFEYDPDLSKELILAFGKKLRMSYYENLPGFVEKIELKNLKEFYELYSDFYSRLGMTFGHGIYSGIDLIKDKDKISKTLYKKSLDYHPNCHAYLGLGIINQKAKAYEESIKILSEGLGYFPDSKPLNICLGISYMNLMKYEKALEYFLKFQDSKKAVYYIANCYRLMGDFEKESIFIKKLHQLPEDLD